MKKISMFFLSIAVCSAIWPIFGMYSVTRELCKNSNIYLPKNGMSLLSALRCNRQDINRKGESELPAKDNQIVYLDQEDDVALPIEISIPKQKNLSQVNKEKKVFDDLLLKQLNAAYILFAPQKHYIKRYEITGIKDVSTPTLMSGSRHKIITFGTDNTMRIWDLCTGKCSKVFENVSDNVAMVTPNSKYIVSYKKDFGNDMHVWDVETGKCIHTLNDHEIVRIVTMQDSTCIVSFSCDNTIRVWDIVSGKCLSVFKTDSYLFNIMLTSDGKHIVSLHRDYTAVWNIATGQCLRKIFSSCGEKLMPNGSNIIFYDKADAAIKICDIASGECLKRLTCSKDDCDTIASTADERYIIMRSKDGMLSMWDIVSGERLALASCNKYAAQSGMTTQGDIIVRDFDYFGKVNALYDMNANEWVSLPENYYDNHYHLAFTPDKDFIIFTDDCKISIFEKRSKS